MPGERGRYIVLEGHDGTGKSAQAARLIARLGGLGVKCLSPPVEEPAGSPVSDELRKIIKNGNLPRDSWSNVLLFTTARRLSWLQTIRPALDSGRWVVSSRNWISTAVYQGYGEGVDIDTIRQFTLDNVHPDYLQPDLQLILSLNDETVRRQMVSQRSAAGEGEQQPDTFESMPDAFLQNVRLGYRRYAKAAGLPVVGVVNRPGLPAESGIELTHRQIWRHVKKLF